MSKPLALACSASAFHALTEATDKKTRGGGDSVKVSKSGLAALLRDHGALHRALKDAGIATQEAEA